MLKKIFTGLVLSVSLQAQLIGHCQMPCGIYHDEMVFDQVDQYVETMVKALTVLNDNKFDNAQDRNAFTRWVMNKDRMSDDMATLITTYFLQQKIKPGEEDTTKRVLSAHQMLFYLVQIKQTVDLKVVKDFYEEWEKFKLMFHIEGYKCKVSQVKLKKMTEAREDSKNVNNESDHTHDHDHDHTHEHQH